MIKENDYADYLFLPKVSYDIISALIDNSDAEILWKLLKGSTKDDWKLPDLTKSQKRALIYDGSENATDFSIFLDSGEDDVLTKEHCQLRIYPYWINPTNAQYGIIDIAFEIICHYSINTLSNYQTRVDTLVATIINCLNGAIINTGAQDSGAIGAMFFNQKESNKDKMQSFNQPPFKGKILIMSIHAG